MTKKPDYPPLKLSDIDKSIEETKKALAEKGGLLDETKTQLEEQIKVFESLGVSKEKIDELRNKMIESEVKSTTIEKVDTNPEENKTSKNKEPVKDIKDENLRSEYYDKALEIITKTGDTTFSNLQRKLKISMGKAKRLLEILEQDGILGPSINGTPREILKKEEKKNINSTEKPETDQEKAAKLSDQIKAEQEERENATKGKEKTKYNFVWETKTNQTDQAYGYYDYQVGTFPFEINGVKSEVVISEEKTEWHEYSRLKKMARFGMGDSGKIIFKKNPSWSVYVTDGNKTLDNKYPKTIYFNTKEEAIEKANEIIEEGMKIKFEEEKKYMGQGATPPPPRQNQNNPGTKTPEPIQNISQEQLLNNLNNLEKLAQDKLDSSKFRGKILKGLDKWENLGKGEGKANFAKRMTKIALNLALIGLVSSIAVDQIANAGIEIAGQTLSNTALAGGTSHYLINKMGIGLGLSASMDRLGNKIPNKVKKWIPWVMGGGSILAAGVLSGGTVAVAAGVGFAASKLLKKNFTNEKIEAKQENARKELLEKIKKEGAEINPEKVKAFENEYSKLLKKYENQKIWGKLWGTAARFGLATIVSTVTLEAAGYAKDMHAEHQANVEKPVEEAKAVEDQSNTSQNDSISEKQNEIIKSDSTENKTPISDTTDMTKESDTTTSQIENTQTPQTAEGNITQSGNIQEFMKSSATQDAIKLGMYTPGEANESMIVQSGTVSFDANGHHVEVPYSSDGAIQTIADLKEKMIAEFGGEEKIPEGNMTTHYVDMNGAEHDQSLIHNDTNGVEVIEKYNGTMFDSDHSHATVEHSAHDSLSDDNKVPEQINHETGEPMDNNTGNNSETQTNESTTPKQVNPKTGLPMDNKGDNSQADNKNNLSNNGNENTTILSTEKLEHVHKVFNHNIDHLFGERPISAWSYIKDHVSATRIMEMYKEGEIKEDFKPLTHYMNQLQNITGIRPQGVDLLHPDPETIPHYIGRALEEAERTGQIGKVTL